MSIFKPSFRPDSPVRPSLLPRPIAFDEPSVAVEERNDPVPEVSQPVATQVPQVAGPMQGIALRCTLVFLFFRISFLHEFIASKIRIDLHILMVLGAVSLLIALMT